MFSLFMVKVTKVAAFIFLLITILHLLRIIFKWPAQIANLQISLWVSIIAVLIAGYLSYALFKEK